MDIFTTMITPFTESGEVDYQTAERYVDWYFENGLTGIFAICQSSEIFYLTLPERIALNRVVYRRAKELERQSGRPFTVVSSGHVSDTIEGQIEELCAVWESGTDALILITNRLAGREESDEVWIENCKKIIAALPDDVKLGLYECPYPYKRLVTPEILDFCLSTGKFYYMKDTCCNAEMIAARVAQLKGSHFKLLNANCQTLLASMKDGADGYCGIMCNFHPRLYSWMGENFASEPDKAETMQAFLCAFGFSESGLPYPLTAKYHMNLCGIPTANVARSRRGEELTPYAKSCVRQMKLASDQVEKLLL